MRGDENGSAARERILVLLPGLDGTGDLFEPLLSRLDPSIKTVVVRYPLAEPLDYEALTSVARRALPATGEYVILGESFSAPIAAQLAAERAGGLLGLILCASFVSSPLPHLQPFEWLRASVRYGRWPAGWGQGPCWVGSKHGSSGHRCYER